MRSRTTSVAALALLLVATAGCGQEPATRPQAATEARPEPASTPAEPDAGAALPAATLPTDVASLAGRWRVTGVAPAAGGVQAYAPNDPAYMGREIDLSAAAFAWNGKEVAGATTGDRCAGPAIQRLEGAAGQATIAEHRGQLDALGMKNVAAYEVACIDGGEWGPSGTMFAAEGGAIAFAWYDAIVVRFARRT